MRTRYLSSGSGPPLLLLASGLGQLRALRALGRFFAVVSVELPGAGSAGRSRRPWSVDRLAEWVLELVRQLPLAAPIVVGEGPSARVAVALAILAPREIGGVVLADPAGAPPTSALRAMLSSLWGALRPGARYAEHVRGTLLANARAALAMGATVSGVPILRARRLVDDCGAIRRLSAAVRRRAEGAAREAGP